jgi:gluconolactonase
MRRIVFIVVTAAILASSVIGTTAAQSFPGVPGAEVVRLDQALDALIAPGTQIEKVAGGFNFTEGPMWHEDRLWISDVVGDKIFAVSATGKSELLVEKAGGTKTRRPESILAQMEW